MCKIVVRRQVSYRIGVHRELLNTPQDPIFCARVEKHVVALRIQVDESMNMMAESS